MATYHNYVRIITRGKGNSVASSIAYIQGERIYDKYLGEWHDNSLRTDVLYKEVFCRFLLPLII